MRIIPISKSKKQHHLQALRKACLLLRDCHIFETRCHSVRDRCVKLPGLWTRRVHNKKGEREAWTIDGYSVWFKKQRVYDKYILYSIENTRIYLLELIYWTVRMMHYLCQTLAWSLDFDLKGRETFWMSYLNLLIIDQCIFLLDWLIPTCFPYFSLNWCSNACDACDVWSPLGTHVMQENHVAHLSHHVCNIA